MSELFIYLILSTLGLLSLDVSVSWNMCPCLRGDKHITHARCCTAPPHCETIQRSCYLKHPLITVTPTVHMDTTDT